MGALVDKLKLCAMDKPVGLKKQRESSLQIIVNSSIIYVRIIQK